MVAGGGDGGGVARSLLGLAPGIIDAGNLIPPDLRLTFEEPRGGPLLAAWGGALCLQLTAYGSMRSTAPP